MSLSRIFLACMKRGLRTHWLLLLGQCLYKISALQKQKDHFLKRGINGLWVRNGSHFWCDTWEPEARDCPLLSQWWFFGRGLTVYRVASTGFSCFILLRTGTTSCATMPKSLVSPFSLQYTPSRLLIFTIRFCHLACHPSPKLGNYSIWKTLKSFWWFSCLNL